MVILIHFWRLASIRNSEKNNWKRAEENWPPLIAVFKPWVEKGERDLRIWRGTALEMSMTHLRLRNLSFTYEN